MAKAKREQRERTDNWKQIQQWCRWPEQRLKDPKPHPFKARFRHEIWSLDIRYIEKHQIPEIRGPFYVISVMDNFSRAILASDIYQSQDLASVLLVLYAAIEQHGCPHRLVTDNGSVFRAKQAMVIYEVLEIQKADYVQPPLLDEP